LNASVKMGFGKSFCKAMVKKISSCFFSFLFPLSPLLNQVLSQGGGRKDDTRSCCCCQDDAARTVNPKTEMARRRERTHRRRGL
jgi:hypothetical protein